MMSNSVSEARFSLILEGDNMPLDMIEKKLKLKPTRIIRKGEVLNRLPMMVAERDEWTHTITLTNSQDTDAEMNQMLARVILCQGVLSEMAANDGIKVRLRLYVQSDYAQMSYRLMPETLQRLVATGLPLDVTSLSWGELGI